MNHSKTKRTKEEIENEKAFARAICELERLQLDARILDKAIQEKREECRAIGSIGCELEKARNAKG